MGEVSVGPQDLTCWGEGRMPSSGQQALLCLCLCESSQGNKAGLVLPISLWAEKEHWWGCEHPSLGGRSGPTVLSQEHRALTGMPP